MSPTVTLGELREMTADLPDSTCVVLMMPMQDDEWRQVSVDVQVATLIPEVQFYAEESAGSSQEADQ